MARNVLKSSLENASFNIIFQVLYRCLTFIINAFILRHISEDVVGVMHVRLLLLESTILFLSREAFRRACLSQSGLHSWPQIINLLWLTSPLCILTSFVFGFIWLNILSTPSDEITTHYSIGVWSICLSCVIEMLCEPLYLVAQVFLFVKLRVVLDSLCIIVRTLVYTPWVIMKPDDAVLAFSAAQLTACTTYCLGYYIYFYLYIKENNIKKKENVLEVMKDKLKDEREKIDDVLSELRKENCNNGSCDKTNSQNDSSSTNRLQRRQSSIVGFDEPFSFTSLTDFLPAFIENETFVHPQSVKLTWSFFKQGILKQILTEGERYVMTLFSVLTFQQQGIYDVVNNLGSLAARFIFRPVEESSYFYFTQTVRREVDISQQNQNRMKETATVLQQLLHCITSIGLVIVTFGQPYSALLLHLYGGVRLSSGIGPSLLRTHCVSVLLLAINGVTECFAFAAMTTQQLDRYNYVMAVLSVSFLIVSWALTRLFGGVGFIIANCCNMAARITHSLFYIRTRYKNTQFKPLSGIVPNTYFLISLILSLLITKFTEHFYDSKIHILVGAICLCGVVITWCLQEKELVKLALNKVRGENIPSDKKDE